MLMMDIQLTMHFKLSEFIKSPTAEKLGIDNTPKGEFVVNLHRLCKELEVIRKRFGKPIYITSGYRCDKLNKAVKGAEKSDHLFGAACDITTGSNELNEELFHIICKLANNRDIIRGNLVPLVHFRQIIDEKKYRWIHLSVNNKENAYKDNEILHL